MTRLDPTVPPTGTSVAAAARRDDHQKRAAAPLATETATTRPNQHGFPPRFLKYAGSGRRFHRYHNGRLNIAGSRSLTVLAHLLVPPRDLDPATAHEYFTQLATGYSEASVARQALSVLARPGQMRALSVGDIRNVIVADAKADSVPPSCSLLFTNTTGLVLRPMALVKTFDYDAVQDDPGLEGVWNRLTGCVADDENDYIDDACFALLVGVECDGFEDGMYVDSPEPRSGTSCFRLCERFALLVGDASVAVEFYSNMSQAPALASGILLARTSSRHSNKKAITAAATPRLPTNTPTFAAIPALAQSSPPNSNSSSSSLPPPFATPSIIADTAAIKASIRFVRYVDGFLHFFDSRCNYSRTLSSSLITPRAMPPSLTKRYMQHVLDRLKQPGPCPRLYRFAIQECGTTNSFSVEDAARTLSSKPARTKETLDRQIARAVCYVGQAANVQVGDPIWNNLASKARRRGASEQDVARAEVVVLVGLEIVGFEDPKAADVLPVWRDRRYVLRERYALVDSQEASPHLSAYQVSGSSGDDASGRSGDCFFRGYSSDD